jgi:hypothetical protein
VQSSLAVIEICTYALHALAENLLPNESVVLTPKIPASKPGIAMPCLQDRFVLAACAFAENGEGGEALTLKGFHHHRSFLPMMCRPARPYMGKNILVWTNLMTGPADSFGLLVLHRAFPSLPDTACHIVSDFIKNENVLFMFQRGDRMFHVDHEHIGDFDFSMLIIPTNSWDMIGEIHDDLLAVGIPYTAARMNQFVNDLLIIMVRRFGCNVLVKTCYTRGAGSPRCILAIAPEEY